MNRNPLPDDLPVDAPPRPTDRAPTGRRAACTSAFLALAALALLSACAPREEAEGRAIPLFDLEHAPDVLVEADELDPPPSSGGNRHLIGWWPRNTERGSRLLPNPAGASIEIAHLESRDREVALWLEHAENAVELPVSVHIGEAPPFDVPLRSPLKIVVPDTTPVGRVPIGFRFPEAAEVHLANVTLGAPRPAGRIDLGRETIRQAGTSRVEIARHIPPTARLRGTFRPPEGARPGQSFEISIETAAEARTPTDSEEPARTHATRERLFRWSSDQPPEPEEILADLPPGAVRFALSAGGEGPPAEWLGLEIELPAALPAEYDRNASPQDASEAALPEPKLVLLYVLDALRADAIGARGGRESASPFLDRLAREGVRFERHQTVAPNTLPSTKAFFTGITPMVRGNWKLGESTPTFAEAFREAGFRTAAFSGNGFLSETYGTVRGFEFVDPDALFEDYTDQPGRYNDNAVAVHDAALRWLDSLAPEERALAYLHTIHPHQPYDPPPDMTPETPGSTIDGSSRTLLDIKHVRRRPTEADRRRIDELYHAALAYNDREFESFLAAVLERYAPEEVVLVITSDHGEELFDHGGVLHGYTLYQEQLDIPLILWAPGRVVAGSVIDRHTANTELGDELRLVASGRPVSELVERLGRADASPTGAPTVRFAAASSVEGGIFMAATDRYKIVWAPRTGRKWGVGEGAGRSRSVEYVFDLASDPRETVNLAGSRDPEIARIRSRLFAWVATESAREEVGEIPTIDAETEARLKALGYLD